MSWVKRTAGAALDMLIRVPAWIVTLFIFAPAYAVSHWLEQGINWWHDNMPCLVRGGHVYDSSEGSGVVYNGQVPLPEDRAWRVCSRCGYTDTITYAELEMWRASIDGCLGDADGDAA